MNPAVEFDMELLIMLVESNPVLWDTTSEVYQEKSKSRKAWREIFNELKKYQGDNFEELSKEEQDKYGKYLIESWNNIRDKFVEYKKIKMTGEKTTIKKFIYETELQFLRKTLDTKKTQDCLQEKDDETITVPDISTDPVKSFSRKRKMDKFEVELLEAMKRKAEPENPHLLFFKSILPSLEKLSDDQVLQFKMSVLQILLDIKKGTYVPSTSPSMAY